MPVQGGAPTVVEPSPQPREPVPPHRLTSRLATGLLRVGGLVAVAAMLLMTLTLGAPLIPQFEYDPLAEVSLGLPSAEVEKVYGTGSPAAAAAAGVQPPAPPGSTCTYVAGGETQGGQIIEIYRFCYAADLLVDKVWIPANGQES